MLRNPPSGSPVTELEGSLLVPALSSVYGGVTDSSPIVLAAPSTPVDAGKTIFLAYVGPWSKPALDRVQWDGEPSEMWIDYTFNFAGQAGDRIQWSVTTTGVATIGTQNPITTIDTGGRGWATMARGVQPCGTGTQFRILVQNLTAARNVTPIFLGFSLKRQPVAASYL